MRRSVLKRLVLVGASMAAVSYVAGCEDGPTQTFTPAPPQAAALWNNGGADAATSDPGSQLFDAGGGGTNAVNICTASQQNTAWSAAFVAPIVPPFSMGGLDLSTAGTFDPFTIEMAEHGTTGTFVSPQLCQGQSAGTCNDGSGNPAYSWGPSGQIYTCYDIASHQLTFFMAQPGYDGIVKFTLPRMYNGQTVPQAVDQNNMPGDLQYVWHIGQAITENGQVLNPKWTGNGIDGKVANKLYLGLMYTFQPTLIAITNTTTNPPLSEMTDPNYDCLVTTKCRTSANPDSSAGNFGVRPVGVYFDAAQSNSTDPATAASPSDIYMYPVKFEPYSLAPYNEGLDTFVSPNADPNLTYNGKAIYGPYSPAGVLSPPGKPVTPFCTLYMGQAWSAFTKACVTTTSDPMLDQLSMAKLLGGQHHLAEWFQFSVVGVNQNVSADTAELTQNGLPSVLTDSAGSLTNPPHGDDVATDFIVDVRANGAVLNDMRGNSSPPTPAKTPLDTWEDQNLAGQDLHGTAAVMGYYRQLVFNDLRAQMATVGVTPQTDPKACWFNSAAPGANPQTWVAPTGCTGFEQMQTPAPVTTTGTWTDQLDVTPQGVQPRTIFRPGDPQLSFMADPVNNVGQNAFVTAADLMQASLQQVTAILGHGNIATVPSAARDWRYYLQFWAKAYLKYLLNRSMDPTWQQLYADDLASTHTLRQINQDALFFDLNNGIDKFEYVDRDPAAQLGSPVDFEYDILINTSNTQTNNFYQRLSRPESALYQAMLADKSQVPGSNENINLSDLFGSLAVTNSGLFAPAADASGKPIAGKDAHYCATTNDSDCLSVSSTNHAPVDSTGALLVDGEGRPLFTNYRGIFTGTAFSIGNEIPFAQTMPYIASALIKLPNYANPYDTTSTNTPITVLVPHVPFQPTNGFEIPINAERSQFVQTGSLDFTGVTITTNVDYLPNYDAKSGALTSGTVAAVETQDFLGEVFPCVDPVSHDILRVRMYTSVLDILNWLDAHPGTRTACNVFVRMSPYNNYPDYIISVTNGVQLSVNPGAGGGPGRISDATIFNPALLTQTQ